MEADHYLRSPDIIRGDRFIRCRRSEDENHKFCFPGRWNIPAKFTCDGRTHSPPLQITGDSSGSEKSRIVIADDPDAPSGVFTHWLVWNIPPQTNSVAEGSAPKGVHGKNDFGKSGYGAPCPPTGAHRYYFRVFALDRELALPSGAKRSQLEAAMKGHVIAQGELMGRYARKQ